MTAARNAKKPVLNSDKKKNTWKSIENLRTVFLYFFFTIISNKNTLKYLSCVSKAHVHAAYT